MAEIQTRVSGLVRLRTCRRHSGSDGRAWRCRRDTTGTTDAVPGGQPLRVGRERTSGGNRHTLNA